MFQPGLMKLLVSAIILSSSINLFAAYSGGSGTATDPWQIATAADLIALGATTADYGKSFILTDDINLTGSTFSRAIIAGDSIDSEEMAYDGIAFTGVFNGNGHQISNLTITGTNNSYVGLFGYIGSGGQVKNLKLVNATIAGWYYTAILCGKNEGVISQCTVSGTVLGSGSNVGGLCGLSLQNGQIILCSVAGSINGAARTGGLCGQNYGTISQCSSTGGIVGTHDVGGLCGANSYGTIDQCSSTGLVTGSGSSTGGLCGWNGNGGAITQSYATGAVAGAGDEFSSAGGLCGSNGNRGVISHCYSTGDVQGDAIAGGLCGDNLASIDQCYSTGEVTGVDLAGGLCGFNWDMIKDSYWNSETAGVTASAGGWGKTTAQMKQASTYSGWSGGYWIINEGVDYPHLAWQNDGGNQIITDYPARTYGGSGSPADPYRIENKEDLLSLSMRSPDWARDTCFILTNDIDLAGESFSQAVIGADSDFNGNFNGNGKVISQLAITADDRNYVGLFGRIGAAGQIRNLGLADAHISGAWYVGCLAGNNQGTITGCYSTGDVSGAADWIGGLCGSNPGAIKVSYSQAKIAGSSESGGLGGLCGRNTSGTITSCYAVNTFKGGVSIGGLCGVNSSGTINYSYWDVQASGRTNSDGGLGRTTLWMQNEYNYGSWDFSHTDGDAADWMMVQAGQDYPRLAWQQPLAGDIAGGWGVDRVDLTAMASDWQKNNPATGDINQDSMVNLADFASMSQNWQKELLPVDTSLQMACWHFDGDGQDSLGDNPITLTNGAAIASGAGEYKEGTGGLMLDGVDDGADCGIGADMNDLPFMTAALWFKVNTLPGSGKIGVLIGQRYQNSNPIWSACLLGSSGGILKASVSNAYAASSFIPAPGIWYHLVMTYDDQGDRKVHLYIDGSELAYTSNTAATDTRTSDSTIPVVLGNCQGGGTPFAGNIDEVRIYRRVITPNEIVQISDRLSPHTLWPFDDDANDSQGSNHGVVTHGAAITNVTGDYKIGAGALQLDGVDDLVNCGTYSNVSGLSATTITMWIKAFEVPATRTMQLMGQRDLSAHIWSLQIWGANSGHITGFVGGNATGALTETAITPVVGQWYHLAMTYDDAGDRKVHLYINGVEAGTVQQTAMSGTRLSSTTIPLIIGDRTGGGRAFGGNIDDVRVYRRMLTPAEIADLAVNP